MTKILIVNNDFDTMSLLETILKRKGFEVLYTSNGGDILSIVRDFLPHIILIDILQRVAAEKLIADQGRRNLKILLMTGYTLRSQKNDIKVDDIIEKPFQIPSLLRKIYRLTNVKSSSV